MNTLVIAPIIYYTDSLRQVTERQQLEVDSLINVISEYNDIPFDQLSLSIGIVAFIAALIVVIAQVWISHLQHKHQLKTAENLNSTQIEISHNKLVADVIARSRHDWIQTLREELSQLMAKMHTYYRIKQDQIALNNPHKDEKELQTLKLQLNVHLLKSRMMLNKNDSRDPDQVKLSNLLEEATVVVNKSDQEVHEYTKELSGVGQKVFKKAWETLKKEVETGEIDH